MPGQGKSKIRIVVSSAIVLIGLTMPFAFAERSDGCHGEAVERDLMAQLHVITRALRESSDLMADAQRVSDPVLARNLEVQMNLRTNSALLARLKVMQRVSEARLRCLSQV